MGRHLGLDAIFCERVNGRFELRRGFEIKENDRVLVVEDVVTTGLSSLESYECIRRNGGQVVAQCSLIDRSNGQAAEKLGIPFIPLIDVDVKVFDENSVPDNLKILKQSSLVVDLSKNKKIIY